MLFIVLYLTNAVLLLVILYIKVVEVALLFFLLKRFLDNIVLEIVEPFIERAIFPYTGKLWWQHIMIEVRLNQLNQGIRDVGHLILKLIRYYLFEIWYI